MTPLSIILVVTFVVVIAIVLGAYWGFIVRPEAKDSADLRRRLKLQPDLDGVTRVRKLDKGGPTKATSPLDKFVLRAESVSSPIARLIKEADIPLTVSTFLLMSVFFASLAYVVVWLTVGFQILAVFAGLMAAGIPYLYVRHKRNQRVWKFEEQFPEAVDLIARALRAGHAFTTSLSMVADEAPDPVAAEFRLLYDRQNYGMPLEEALKDLALRVPLLDARFFVTAVLMQRETGGNLAEVLDNLTHVIRDRFQVKRQVRVLTAHGRLTGWILAGLPPALALALFMSSPNHMRMLIEDPLGVQMIVGAVTLQILGTVIIRKLVNVPY